MSPLVEASDLDCGYGKLVVVRGLSFKVERGEVVAMLGSNGAGKTTTLLTIAGVLPPLAGRVDVLGRAVQGHRPDLVVRRGLAFVPQDRGLFPDLTARQNLGLILGRRDQRRRNIAAVLEAFPVIPPFLGRRVSSLSGGEQQILALARALATAPDMLVVDELSMGLAPQLVQQLLDMIRTEASRRGMGVLLVEQHATQALSVADTALVLRHGELVLSTPAAQLRHSPEALEAAYLGEVSDANRAPTLPQRTSGESTKRNRDA